MIQSVTPSRVFKTVTETSLRLNRYTRVYRLFCLRPLTRLGDNIRVPDLTVQYGPVTYLPIVATTSTSFIVDLPTESTLPTTSTPSFHEIRLLCRFRCRVPEVNVPSTSFVVRPTRNRLHTLLSPPSICPWVGNPPPPLFSWTRLSLGLLEVPSPLSLVRSRTQNKKGEQTTSLELETLRLQVRGLRLPL